MRRQDEIDLFAEIRKRNGRAMSALDGAVAIGMNEKRLHAILDKWVSKGWWNYGVTLRSGWLTDSAPGELTP
jgi:hypothetical protein